LHVPFIAFAIAQAGLGLAVDRLPSSKHDALAIVLVLAAGAIQVRHSLAAARGTRPRYWPWTLVLLVALVYVPAPWFGVRWSTLQWFVLTSFAMLLDRRLVVGAIVAGECAWFVAMKHPDPGLANLLAEIAYLGAVHLLGVIGLYGAIRLVRLHDGLRAARAELADLAMGRERLRISRDLHDLLGQSLTAVSLKGDLAIGLLERNDIPRAITEIDGLTAIARSTLRDVLDIAHREPPIALASEIERMVDLLASIGTETRVEVMPGPLPPAIDELFAWALREGMTNVLRHSTATTCSISVARGRGTVRLEIINDGAMPVASGGSGLSGLATRAAELSGTASGRPFGDGRFQLTVEVPEETP
jgi:two-component system sensor histidine kinase DesK